MTNNLQKGGFFAHETASIDDRVNIGEGTMGVSRQFNSATICLTFKTV
jgi:hypothetical protein